MAAAPAARGGTPWFDAGIAGLESWPSDGSDLVVAGAGTWRGTGFAQLSAVAKTLEVSAPVDAALTFEPRSPRDFADGDACIRATMTFAPPESEGLPALPASLKAALLVAAPGGSEAQF